MEVCDAQHELFRASVRSFVEREVVPHVEAWEAAGRIPRSIWSRMGELGFLGRDGDAWVLNGSKMFITNGATADVYFVAARVEAGDAGRRHRGISMFLVERHTPGFTVSRTPDKMGMRASDTAELSFQDVRVHADHLLGREGVGFYEVMRVFQRERLVAGLQAVAVGGRALADTLRVGPGR